MSSRLPKISAALSRRRFLRNSAIAGAAAWLPAFRIGPAEAAATCAPPPNFPAGIELYQQAFENWSTEIRIDDLWTCSPATPADCVELANWAWTHGWRLRPRGAMHNWSPIHVTPDTRCGDNVVLVNTTDRLTAMAMADGEPAAVRVQAGAFMEDLLGFLEGHGHGMNNVPAPGDITVGGALAVDAHGTAIPALGESRQPGHSYGTLSNLVLSITVVAWNGSGYELRTYDRSHPHCKALITNLGRTLVTDVVLQVGRLQNLRCQSFVDIPYTELMGPPGQSGGLLTGAARTFQSFLDSAGRAEIIWFPFTDKPWLKVWSVAPTKPLESREVSEPYNYPFSDNIPEELEELSRELTRGNKESTPLFGQMSYGVTAAGLVATGSQDIWGPAKNTQLYIKPTTLRITASGYAVTTRRDNIQRVVHDFTQQYLALVGEYEARGEYPMNMPVEIRVNGLDRPAEVEKSGAEAPALSAASPDASRPDWDVVVWFNCLSFPGTEKADEFYERLEQWFHSHFGDDALVRPEWSKGWGYTAEGAWRSGHYLHGTVPESYRLHRSGSENWDWAVRRLDQLDPYRVFSNDFLDALLV